MSRDWMLRVGLVAAGLVLAWLLPDWWGNLIGWAALAVFAWMIVVMARGGTRRERREEARRQRDRFRKWGPGDS